MLEPGGQEALDQRLYGHPAVLLPAGHRDVAIALGVDIDVQRQHDALGAVFLHPAGHQIRRFDGGGADHYPTGAGGQQIRHILFAAHAAPHLHRCFGGRQQLGDEGKLARLGIFGTVQIHQVQLHCPLGDIFIEAGLRAVAVSGLLAVVALIEPHDLAVNQINGWDNHPC